MGYRTITRTAAALLCGLAVLAAAQEAPAPKPLVRLDLLVLGPGEVPPPVRDIFRPRAAASAAVQTGGPSVRPAPGGPAPAPAPAPAFALNISYLGSIKSGGRVIGLVLRGGQTLDVGEGDEIAPGYKVVGVTAEAIVVEGPNGERKTFAKQGDRP
ncbi:MAG: hypothetical protein MUE80_03930 [Acidobacteria bacterium]|jgi:hypothetical protein|nr:hypothetical protein [Acidobacteriota bacterium]